MSAHGTLWNLHTVDCSEIKNGFVARITKYIYLVMQEASDAHSKTADSDTVSTYQVSSVQLVTDKKLEAFNKA